MVKVLFNSLVSTDPDDKGSLSITIYFYSQLSSYSIYEFAPSHCDSSESLCFNLYHTFILSMHSYSGLYVYLTQFYCSHALNLRNKLQNIQLQAIHVCITSGLEMINSLIFFCCGFIFQLLFIKAIKVSVSVNKLCRKRTNRP